MTESTTFFVGLDVHKDWISAAVLESVSDAPPDVVTLPYDERKLRRLLERVRQRGPVRACYEASGGGYALQRRMASWGMHCDVIAPSLIPQRPGDRCKTDERDAKQLALLYRAGLLTPVHVPSVDQERTRDLVRCRDAVRHQLHRSRQQVLKFLRTRGLVFRDTKHWTLKHWSWLRALELPAEDHEILQTHLLLLDTKAAQMTRLDGLIDTIAATQPYRQAVGRLCCLRGVRTLTAMTLVTAIGDVRRFPAPAHLMSYVGLTPSEHSSGGPGHERRGKITKTGDPHCRFVLVEAAHHYRHRPLSSRDMRKRWQGQPPEVVAHARRAQTRLCGRFRKLAERLGPNAAAVAVARELLGFVWALMHDDPQKWLAARPR